MPSEKPKVLVVVIRSGPKTYCWNWWPHFAEKLQYENKTLLLVNEENCPKLAGVENGDLICAFGRDFGVHYAREHNFEYIFFLDLDFEPDPMLLDEMVNLHYPLVGALVAARGNPHCIIGHNYCPRESLHREPLYYYDLKHGDPVDGISGAALLVHRSIFLEVDYSGYTGVDTIPGRTTCDDEFYQIQIFNKLKIKPRIVFNSRGWHYHSDGVKYRVIGNAVSYK
jgi:hypothetical protein